MNERDPYAVVTIMRADANWDENGGAKSRAKRTREWATALESALRERDAEIERLKGTLFMCERKGEGVTARVIPPLKT